MGWWHGVALVGSWFYGCLKTNLVDHLENISVLNLFQWEIHAVAN